uniref:Uncharacterized protein n=1 Tax=Panagrolaimus davidi TaxID=227884 RepID=A0A914P4W0_9BILA
MRKPLNQSIIKSTESSGAGAGSTNNSSVERANLLKQVFAAPSKITTHNLQPSYPDIAPSFVEIKKKGLCVHGYVQIVEDAADENHNGTFSLLETNIANLINEALVTGNLLTCPISSHSFHQILTTLQIIDLRYLNFHLTDNLLLRDLEEIIAMNSNLKSIDLTAPAVENGEYQEMLFLMAGVPKVTLNITSLKLRDLALTPHCGRHFSTLKISELSEKPSGADCVALLNNYVSINGTLELRFDSEKDADAVSDEVDDVERPFQLQKRLILLFDLDSDDERCGDENDITHDL